MDDRAGRTGLIFETADGWARSTNPHNSHTSNPPNATRRSVGTVDIDSLGVAVTDHVLDIGCGPGRRLSALALLASQGRIVGADPSELMVDIALEQDQGLVKRHRVEVVIACAGALPFDVATFDKALCVHVVYIWNDLDAAIREIACVLRPEGRLALLFRTSADEKAVRTFPAEVFRFPSLPQVIASLEAAGLAVEKKDDLSYEPRTTPVLLVATKLR